MVPANKFLRNFASDRSHMLVESTSHDSVGLSSPPSLQHFKPIPTWEAVVGEGARSRGETNNLFSHWLDMDDGKPAARTRSKHDDEPFGRVLSLESFAGRSDWIGAAWMGRSGREQAYTTPLAEGLEKKILPESAAHPSPLLSQPVPLSISASPHKSTSEKAAHLAQKAEKTVQRALVPVPPEEIRREEPSSNRWPSYLPPRQLMISIFVSLGINFAIPFVNGVMLGALRAVYTHVRWLRYRQLTYPPPTQWRCDDRLWRDLCPRLVRALGRPDLLVDLALPSRGLIGAAQDRHTGCAQPEPAPRAERRKGGGARSSCCEVHRRDGSGAGRGRVGLMLDIHDITCSFTDAAHTFSLDCKPLLRCLRPALAMALVRHQ